jgi:hypothetical protein
MSLSSPMLLYGVLLGLFVIRQVMNELIVLITTQISAHVTPAVLFLFILPLALAAAFGSTQSVVGVGLEFTVFCIFHDDLIIC